MNAVRQWHVCYLFYIVRRCLRRFCYSRRRDERGTSGDGVRRHLDRGWVSEGRPGKRVYRVDWFAETVGICVVVRMLCARYLGYLLAGEGRPEG